MFKVRAGFTEPNSSKIDLSNFEVHSNEMVESDAAGNNIASRLSRLDHNSIITLYRLDSFDFYQGDITTRPRIVGVRSCSSEVSVALKSTASYGLHFIER